MKTRNFVSLLSALLLSFIAGCGKPQSREGLQGAQNGPTNPDAAVAPSGRVTYVAIRNTISTSNTKVDVRQTTLNSSLRSVNHSTQSLQVSSVENQSDEHVVVNVADATGVVVPAVAALPVSVEVAPVQSGSQWTRFYARSGSKMAIDGTANMINTHWRVEGQVIGGYLDADPGFPSEPAPTSVPARVEATANVFISVPSLKSNDSAGNHFSDAMDNVMYERLKVNQFKRIEYHLTELVLRKSAGAEGAPYLFDAKGELVVAGVTNALSMPVSALPVADQKLKITGGTSVKMTTFGIVPPVMLDGMLKVGDEVKLSFDWMLARRAPSAAAPAN